MAYYVYLLRCKDGSIYGGIATDPSRRLSEHQKGSGAKYTRAHGALYMERVWLAENKSAASKIEYAVKHLKKEQKEELVLSGDLQKYLPDLYAADCGKNYTDKLDAAKKFCAKNPLLTLDILEAIKQGIAYVVYSDEKGVLTYLPKSKFYQLCAERDAVKTYLDKMDEDWEMTVVHHDYELEELGKKYNIEPMEPVVNAYYPKKKPPEIPESDAIVRPLDAKDLPFVKESYSLYDADEELELCQKQGDLLGAYVSDRPVGYVGIHEEGAMGMLYVAPEYRNKNYATALVAAQIARLLKQKKVPFGQIFFNNIPSLNLQKKLGFVFSEPQITWAAKV